MNGALSGAGPADILLVEDNPDDALLTRIEFEDSGILNPLFVVDDGAAALQYLRHEGPHRDARRPGLVLLDLHLPRVDGHEVLAEIEQDDDLRSIPIIVVSAPTELDQVQERFADVIIGALPKPVETPALREVLRGAARLDSNLLRVR